jgi:hypothetical protein
MSEPLPSSVPAPVAPEKQGGFQNVVDTHLAPREFLPNLIDVYFAPREAFTRIVRKPAWLLPAIAVFLIAGASTGIWLAKVDAHAFTQRQMEEFGGKRWEQAPPEQKAQSLDIQAKVMAPFRWVRVGLGTPLLLVLVGGVLLFVFRFFYAAEVTFPQALAIVSWSLLAIDLLTSPLRLLVMWLKEDWNIEPQLALQASPAALLDPAAPKWQWALLSVPDLFSLWLVFLLATGFAVACRRTTSSAIWGVGVPWLLVSLGFVAMAALFM